MHPMNTISFQMRFVFALLVTASVAMSQTTRHVPSQYATIAAGVAAAQSGDTVLVAPGTYFERNIVFGFKAICVRGEAGPEQTIIDCEYFGRAFHITAPDAVLPVRISGFTIRNGRISSLSGGAIYAVGTGSDLGSLMIDHCHFVDNRSGHSSGGYSNSGGAVYSLCGRTIIQDCRFLNNVGGTLNEAVGLPYDGRGGAAFVDSQVLADVRNCEFTNNRSGEGTEGFSSAPHGGALWVRSSKVRILGSEFRGNRTGRRNTSAGAGSAAFVQNLTSTASIEAIVAGCVFFDNSLGRSDITNPFSHSGALHLEVPPQFRVENCTFVSNRPSYSIGTSTIPGGYAAGGAIGLTGSPGNTANNIFRCIFWDSGSVPIVRPSVFSPQPFPAERCLSDVPLSGNLNLLGDPGFVDGFFGDLALRSDSLAVDAGGPDAAYTGMDIDDEPRVMGAAIDLGADEYTKGASMYPGTNEDLRLYSWVNGGGNPASHRKTVMSGSTIDIAFQSPNGSFVNSPYVLAGSVIASNPGPGPGFLPGIWLPPSFTIIADGVTPLAPGFAPVLGVQGFEAHYFVPYPLVGASILLQGAAIDPRANNTVYATTDAHEFVLGAPTHTFTRFEDLPIVDGEPISWSCASYPSGVESSLDVLFGSGVIQSLRVVVEIEHTYPGDLTFCVTAPSGQSVLLFQERGQGADNMLGTSFTGTNDPNHSAIGWIATSAEPFSGAIYRPEDTPAFDALYGTNPNGRWTLRISDRYLLDVGVLRSWSLEVGVQ